MSDQPRSFIAYCRVSTAQQGRSGLGLDAQLAAINGFVRQPDRLLQPPYVEVESGRLATRPKLAEALARCRKTGATLLVAKLDRLSRNVVFLRTLIDSGVDVAFCDLPHIPPGAMGRFLLTQMAAVAELEAGLVSERTKAALAAAKARGAKLGGDRGYRPLAPPIGKPAPRPRPRRALRLPIMRRIASAPRSRRHGPSWVRTPACTLSSGS